MATPATGILPDSAKHLAGDPQMVKVHQIPSPNCGPRRGDLALRFVILHYTAMATADDAIERLCDPRSEVSAHYVICKTGRITQLVGEGLRAWHAGAGEWQGLQDINSRSIGIELDNDGQGPFSEPLMHSLEALLVQVLAGWDIPPQNVIGHSDMAPGRKFDPGPYFDWGRLEAKGLAGNHRTADDALPNDEDTAIFRALARDVGYTADVDDKTLLSAMRLRHRPFACGPVTGEDISALRRQTKQA